MVAMFSWLYRHSQRLVMLTLSLVVLFILGCEAPSGDDSLDLGPKESHLSLVRDFISSDGQSHFVLKTFVRDGVTVYQDGKSVGQLKKLWDVTGVYWGFRKKSDLKKIYWVQKNKSAVGIEGVQYNIEVDDVDKARFVPQALPPDLLHEPESNLEVYAVVEINDVLVPGVMDLPIGFLTGALAGVTLVANGSSQVTATWNRIDKATGYQVKFWKTDAAEPADSTATPVAQPASGATVTWPQTGLEPDTGYSFKVRAVGGVFAPAKIVKTSLIPSLASVALVANGSNQVTATWDKIYEATSGYQVKLWKTLGSEPDDSAATPVAQPASGTTVTWPQAGLDPDTSYSIKVRAVHGVFASSAATAKTSLIAAPTGVILTPNGSTQMTATWDKIDQATGYQVKFWQDGMTEPDDSAATPVAQPASGATVTWPQASLEPDTGYSFKVRAVHGVFTTTAATAKTSSLPAPTGLSLKADSSAQITATWDQMTTATSGYQVTGYQVKYWKDGDPEPDDSTATPVAQPASGTTVTWPQAGLDPDTTYKFKVRAVHGVFSGEKTEKTPLIAAPTGVILTPGSSSPQITVDWSAKMTATWDRIDQATSGYQVKLWKTGDPEPDDNTATPVAQSAPGATVTWLKGSLDPDTTYKFKVRAVHGHATEIAKKTLLIPALSVTLRADSSTQITATWDRINKATSGYQVKFWKDGDAEPLESAATAVAQPGSGSTVSWPKAGLDPDATYHFNVRAANGVFAPTAATAKTSSLTAPTGVSLKPDSSSQITATWDRMTTATSGYQVKLWKTLGSEPDDSTATAVAQPASGSTVTWPWPSLEPDTSYSFKVRAVNGVFSSEVAKKTSKLRAPTGVSLTPVSSSQMRATWDKMAEATSGYQVKFWHGTTEPADNTATTVAQPTSGATVTWDSPSDLSADTTYNFKVRAVHGEFATEKAEKTSLIAAPTGVILTPVSSAKMTATWDRIDQATSGYQVKFWHGTTEPADSTATTVAQPASGAIVTWSKASLDAETTYNFKVRAVHGVFTTEIAKKTLSIGAPTGVSLKADSSSQITVTWNRIDQATSGYQVKYWQDHTTEPDDSSVTMIVAQPGSGSTVSWPQPGLSPDTTYNFKVRAVHGVFSNEVAEKTSSLTAPTNVILTPNSSTKMTATWDRMTTATSGYQVKLWKTLGSEPDDSTATAVAQPTSGSTVTWPWPSLEPDTSYSFKVRAVNGSFSGEVAKKTSKLPAPTGVSLTPVSSSQMRATWDKMAEATSGYQVKFWHGTTEPADNTATTVAQPTSGATVTWDSLSDLSANTTYNFKVRAVHGEFATAVNEKTSLLPAPTGLSLQANSSAQITATWNRMSRAASGYRVKYWKDHTTEPDDSSVTMTVVQPGSGATVSWPQAGLDPDTTYNFKVAAVNGVFSGEKSEKTSLIGAPTNVILTPNSSAKMTATWDRIDQASSGYLVKFWKTSVKEPDDNTATPVVQPGSGTTVSWPQAGLDPDTEYSIKVRAANGVFTTVAVTKKTLSIGAPTGVSLRADSSAQITMTWNRIDQATSGYQVKYWKDGATEPDDVTATAVAQPGSGTTVSWPQAGLDPDTSYHFRVRAVNGVFSGEKTERTSSILAPTGVSLKVDSPSQITVTWNRIDQATSYQVKHWKTGDQEPDNSTATTVAQPGSGSTVSWPQAGLDPETSYSFKVRAVHGVFTIEMVKSTSSLLAPTGVSLTAAGSNQMRATWNRMTTATLGYQVKFWQDGTTEPNDNATTPVAQPASGTTVTWSSSTSLSVSTTYKFKVRAVRGVFSGEATGKTSSLPAPTGVSLKADSSSQITVTWNRMSQAASGYQVKYWKDGTTEPNDNATTPVAQPVSGTTVSWPQAGLDPDAKYRFKVRAVDGAFSGEKAEKTSLIAAPTGLSVTPISSAKITAAWDRIGQASAGYRVKFWKAGTGEPDESTATAVAQPSSGSSVTWSWTNLDPDTSYSVKVAAVHGVFGGEKAEKTLPLSAPTGLVVTPDAYDGGAVNLIWNRLDQADSGYQLKVWETGTAEPHDSTMTPVSQVRPGRIVSWKQTGLKAGTNYSVKVRGASTGAFSAVKPVKTLLPAISLGGARGLDAQTTSLYQGKVGINVKWAFIPGATGYQGKYWRYGTPEPSDSAATALTSTDPTNPTYFAWSIANLNPSTGYNIRVRAIGGAWSAVMAANTASPVPKNVKMFAGTTPGSLVVTWDRIDRSATAPNGQDYGLRIWRADWPAGWEKSLGDMDRAPDPGSGTTVTWRSQDAGIAWLSPNTDYKVQVRAGEGPGSYGGEYSNAVTGRSAP